VAYPALTTYDSLYM